MAAGCKYRVFLLGSGVGKTSARDGQAEAADAEEA